MLMRQGQAGLGLLECLLGLPPTLMEHNSPDSSVRQTKCMLALLRQGERLADTIHSLVRIATQPQEPSGIEQASRTGVLAIAQGQGAVLRCLVEGNPLFHVGPGCSEFPQEEKTRP